METYLIIYLAGVFTITFALMDELSYKELLTSFVASLLWPVLLPIRIVKKLIRN